MTTLSGHRMPADSARVRPIQAPERGWCPNASRRRRGPVGIPGSGLAAPNTRPLVCEARGPVGANLALSRDSVPDPGVWPGRGCPWMCGWVRIRALDPVQCPYTRGGPRRPTGGILGGRCRRRTWS
jgi:hypothetical protein